MSQAAVLHNNGIHGTMNSEQKRAEVHSPKDEIQNLLDKAEDYFKTRKDLLKLKAVSKASDVTSSIVSKTVSAVFFLLFFLVLTIGLGLLIGDWLGASYWGFFVLAGLYLLIGIVLVTAGDKMIKRSVANKLIEKFIK